MEPTRLADVALFEGLTQEELASCAARFQEVEVLSDHNVARDGDGACAFFLVLDGELDVHVNFECVATLRPGDFFGEMGLENNAQRSAHVATRGRVQLAKNMVWDYKQMVDEFPVVHERITSIAAARSSGDS